MDPKLFYRLSLPLITVGAILMFAAIFSGAYFTHLWMGGGAILILGGPGVLAVHCLKQYKKERFLARLRRSLRLV